MASTLNYEAVTILSGASTSNALSLKGKTVVGLIMPAAFTGTALTFTSSTEIAGTFTTLYSAGSDLSVTVAASKHVALTPANFASVDFLKLVSNGTEAADRVIIVISRVME